MSTFGAIMLHWQRPANVEAITRSWLACPFLSNKIVWANKHPLPNLARSIVTVQTSIDLGMYTRFHAAILTCCDAVLIQDDDVLLSQEAIAGLLSRWENEPDLLHTLFGRCPRRDNTYSESFDCVDMEVDIALTRAVVVSRELLCRFMFDYLQFEHMQTEAIVYGNGEDIIMSYVAQKYSGKKNRCWNFEKTELPAGNDSLHRRDWEVHIKHRTRVMHACQEWIK